MKKAIIVFVAMATVATLFCGCGKAVIPASDSENPTYTNTIVEEPGRVISRTEALQMLVEEYQKGEWDGEPKNTDALPGHTYTVKQGLLFEDDNELYCADLTIGQVSFDRILGNATLADGTFAMACDKSTIARFYKGNFINCADLSMSGLPRLVNEKYRYWTWDRFIAIQFGQYLSIFDYLNLNELGQWTEVEALNDVIDVAYAEEGIKISNFKHDNFTFQTTRLEKIGTHYTKFGTELDYTMSGIPENIAEGLLPNCRILYAGTGSDDVNYYVYQNKGDIKTYTLVYRNGDTGVTKVVSQNVTDAESVIGGCYFIEDSKVFCTKVDDMGVEITKVFIGTAYGLTPAFGEDDAVCIIATENEASVHDSNGWDNLLVK